jgi:hypothetical protein
MLAIDFVDRVDRAPATRRKSQEFTILFQP